MNNTALTIGKDIRETIIGSGIINERVVTSTILKHDDSASPEMLEYVPSFVDAFINGPKMGMNDFSIIGYNFSQTYIGLDPESAGRGDIDSMSLIIRNSGIFIEKEKALTLAHVVKGILG